VRPNPTLVGQFARSMPPEYLRSFDWTAVSEHAGIALGRRPGFPALGACRTSRLPGIALCVVTDDRPGLLAAICAVFVEERLNIAAAEAYTRLTAPGQREAVDIFWVDRLDHAHPHEPLTDDELKQLEDRLAERLRDTTARSPSPLPQRATLRPETGRETIVRFVESAAGMLSAIEVEADDHTGMLFVLSHALSEEKVQIVSSRIRTEAGRAYDRFDVKELDDRPISSKRRLTLQVAILQAVHDAFAQ